MISTAENSHLAAPAVAGIRERLTAACNVAMGKVASTRRLGTSPKTPDSTFHVSWARPHQARASLRVVSVANSASVGSRALAICQTRKCARSYGRVTCTISNPCRCHRLPYCRWKSKDFHPCRCHRLPYCRWKSKATQLATYWLSPPRKPHN